MSGLKNFSSALTLVMLAIFVTMVAVADGYPAEARFMPWVVGIPAIIFCIVQLVLDFRRDTVASLRDGQPTSALRGLPHEEDEAAEDDPGLVRRELVLWGHFVAFIAAILMFGFWVAVPSMLTTFLRYQGGKSWVTSAGLASLATLVLWSLFTALLGIRLFAGFLSDDILALVGA